MAEIGISVLLDGVGISQETLTAVIRLVAVLKPAIVVEAGTYTGSFAVAAATANPTARVYTADPIDHNCAAIFAQNAVTDRVTYVPADFEAIAERHPEVVGHVDLAFIDSGWPFVGGQRENNIRSRHFEAAKRWLAPSGIILIDDLAQRDWPGASEIAAECCVVIPTDRGLGFWRQHTQEHCACGRPATHTWATCCDCGPDICSHVLNTGHVLDP